MKRRVLCVFLLILYLLVVCSMLSGKIAEEMATLVQIEKRTASKTNGRSMTLNIRAVYTDSSGDHLYEVREGDGWDRGLRSYDVPGFGLNFLQGVVTLYGSRDYFFVKSASRQPQDGELAKIVETFETIDDTYLYYYNHGVPEELDLPTNLEVIARSENVLLVDVTDGVLPFLPHTARTWTVTTDMSDHVFSLTEAETFLNELPKVACVFVILIFGLVMWLLSCCLSIQAEENKWLIWLNVMLILLSLLILQYTLNNINLPASMLPPVNIFDVAHYQEEFSLIFDTLQEMGMTNHSIFQTVSQVKSQCMQLAFGFGISAICVLVLETFYIHLKHSDIEKFQKCSVLTSLK